MKRFARAALAAAALAAVILPENAPGIGVLLVAVAVAAALVLVGPPSRDLLVFGGLALALVAMASVRAAEWLVAIDLLAAMSLATVAAVGVEGWRDLFRWPVVALVALMRAPAAVVGPLLRRGRPERRLAPALRGGAIGLALVLLFGSLFVSADTAFGTLLNRALVPNWDLGSLPARVFVFVATALAAGTLAAIRPVVATPSAWVDRDAAFAATREPRRLAPLEWGIALGLLDVLFAAFVAVQITFLFGGHELVQRVIGLSYAEYARQGFFQLVAVAMLVLAVIAGAVRWSNVEAGRERVLFRALLGALCALTLVILVSTLYRLGLYEATFGLTRTRLVVDATVLWLGGVIVMVMAAGMLWRGGWLPRAMLGFSAASLLVFSLLDPDAMIASRNIQRFDDSGRIDTEYLAALSVDAWPAIGDLPPHRRRLVVQRFDPSDLTGGWPSWNASRERARRLHPCLISPRRRC